MKLAINIGLSLVMLVGCIWLVWPAEPERLATAFSSFELRYLAPYFALLIATHFCRAWRWNNLLAPIGAQLSPGRLLAVSSVGFMAILALPARLGEFVRPALIREPGKVSASAALGTVAVERIVDGLLVSVMVSACLLSYGGDHKESWIMPAAYTALAIFGSALTFLVFALRWPKQTVRFCTRVSLLDRFAPRIASLIEDKLLSLISGFTVLKDKRNLATFVLWSIAYWTANGFSVYILARGFHLDLSVVGAFATMGIIAVGIMLPNAPALAGQYQAAASVGLALYLGGAVAESEGLAFSILLHGLQVLWYIGMGALALATRYVSIGEILRSRRQEPQSEPSP